MSLVEVDTFTEWTIYFDKRYFLVFIQKNEGFLRSNIFHLFSL